MTAKKPQTTTQKKRIEKQIEDQIYIFFWQLPPKMDEHYYEKKRRQSPSNSYSRKRMKANGADVKKPGCKTGVTHVKCINPAQAKIITLFRQYLTDRKFAESTVRGHGDVIMKCFAHHLFEQDIVDNLNQRQYDFGDEILQQLETICFKYERSSLIKTSLRYFATFLNHQLNQAKKELDQKPNSINV